MLSVPALRKLTTTTHLRQCKVLIVECKSTRINLRVLNNVPSNNKSASTARLVSLQDVES